MLSPAAHAAITDPSHDLLLSSGSIWEIAIKVGLKKLALSRSYRAWIEKAITDLDLSILTITVEYADALSTLPKHHKDTFDRLLVAHAQVEKIPIVSGDATLDSYGITRMW